MNPQSINCKHYFGRILQCMFNFKVCTDKHLKLTTTTLQINIGTHMFGSMNYDFNMNTFRKLVVNMFPILRTLFYCISWHNCNRYVTRQLTHLQRRKLVDIPGSQKLLLQPCCPSSLSYVWISGRSTLPHAFVLIDLSIFRSVHLLNYFYLVPLRIILTSELPATISPYTIRRRGCVSPAAGSYCYCWKAADFTVVKWNNWDECIFTFFGAQSYVFLGTP